MIVWSSNAGPSGKVVAAAVAAPPTGKLSAERYALDSEEEELLSLVEMPGMEEAVKARVLLLFPEKEKAPDPLQRSKSI